MHLFDKVDLKQTQTSFYITMVLVSVATWLISAFFIWGVNRKTGAEGVEGDLAKAKERLAVRSGVDEWTLPPPSSLARAP